MEPSGAEWRLHGAPQGLHWGRVKLHWASSRPQWSFKWSSVGLQWGCTGAALLRWSYTRLQEELRSAPLGSTAPLDPTEARGALRCLRVKPSGARGGAEWNRVGPCEAVWDPLGSTGGSLRSWWILVWACWMSTLLHSAPFGSTRLHSAPLGRTGAKLSSTGLYWSTLDKTERY